MNCPICKSEKVGEHDSQCLECKSDLTSFILLNEVSNQRSSLKKSMMMFAAVAVITLCGWAYTYTQGNASAAVTADEVEVPDNTGATEIEALKKVLASKDAEITSLNSKLTELQTTIESSLDDVQETDADGTHTLHIVKDGESLWSISQLYHGHGFKHHHIAGQNEVNNPNHIEVGDTLVINN